MSCLLIPVCVHAMDANVCLRELACARTCVCVVFLTNKPPDKKKIIKNRLICTSLHRISINLPAIYTPGTLITRLLRSPNK